MGYNVMSLFDGMCCGRMAMEDLGLPIGEYYSSEIDKFAIKATTALFPDAIHLGDVLNWREWDIDWSSIDLVTGGFPCQAWSMAGKQLGDKDERGMLFWTMLDIMKHVKYHNPKAHFLIENVKMKKEFEEYITTHTENALGYVHKILINSALVSAQNRNRYYWTSFEVEQPGDKRALLHSVLETGIVDRDKAYALTARYYKVGNGNINRYANKSSDQVVFELFGLTEKCIAKFNRYGVRFIEHSDNKAKVLTAGDYAKLGKYGNYLKSASEEAKVRKLTPRECMRLQTIPEHHIETLLNTGISNTQLYKMTGNGWTIDVISHILSHLKEENTNET